MTDKEKDKEKFALIGEMAADAANLTLEGVRRASDIIYGMKILKEMYDAPHDGSNNKKGA